MGWDNISHSGATAGYRAYLETFPELNLSIAILSNTSQFNISNVASMVRKIFVPDKTQKVIKNESGIHLSEAKLNSVAGMYKNERNNSTFQLSVKNKNLVLDNEVPLITVSENIFKADNFLFEIKGSKGLYIPFSPRDTIPFTKVSPANLSPKDFKIYEGKYHSEETNSSIIVRQDNNKLMIHINPDEIYQLIPTYTDAFKIDELDCDVQFAGSHQNNILSMKMSVGRARNVAFKKLQ